MPTYTPLQSIELTSASASVIFSGIPQTYQDLVVIVNAGNSGGTGYGLSLQFNGDTTSNYSFTHLFGTGSSALSSRSTSTTFILGGYTPSTIGGSTCLINIANYSNTTTYKTVISRGSESDYRVGEIVGLWRSTSAVTSIRLLDEGANNFLAGSTFDLYGISPVAADTAQAFGGTEVYYDSTYVYHVFKGSGAFIPYRNLTLDYLVVAGGGAGGDGVSAASGNGGGGAGGLRSTVGTTGGGGSLPSSISVTSGITYTITVGAGGATATDTKGANGSNSSISGSGLTTITSTGGGGGAGYSAGGVVAAGNGGSGGGDLYNGTSPGTRTVNEGFAGGNGAGSPGFAGGGGGGAGAVGANATTTAGGNGGAGVSITGFSTATGTGVSNYYAGGGGGGTDGASYTAGTGGSGGGGDGGKKNSTSPTSGMTNTGGGGGATGSSGNSGSGGSGIVILRYAR